MAAIRGKEALASRNHNVANSDQWEAKPISASAEAAQGTPTAGAPLRRPRCAREFFGFRSSGGSTLC